MPPPESFQEAHEILLSVLDHIRIDELEVAKRALENPLAEKIKSWYAEHGQMSGFHRFAGLKSSKSIYVGPLEPEPSPRKLERSVFIRDNFKCQYCMISVMSLNDLKEIESKLGRANFVATGRTNAERHGFVFAVRATADHVLPVSQGGRTSMDNLVTSCWSCNFGKSEYSLSQIGLCDPRQKSVSSLIS